ncbi:MAG: ABC transporter permease [Chloroflexia bacterium]
MGEITAELIEAAEAGLREHRSPWVLAWRRLMRNRTARLGLAIVLFFVLGTVLAHFFWPYDPKTDSDYSLYLKPPTLVPTEEVPSVHIFGTDVVGRDVFRRIVHGGWSSLRVGLVAVGISLSIGGLLGLLAGFYESMPIGRGGQAVLGGLIGLGLGLIPALIGGQVLYGVGEVVGEGIRSALTEPAWLAGVLAVPAWIARFFLQNLEIGLFGALGVLAVLLEGERFPIANGRPRSLRVVILSGLGLLLGLGPALAAGPYVALVCALLGALIGGILSLPLSGALLSNLIMRVMDILLAFPGILLAIAIATMLGAGLDKGMIAIGIVNIPIYARLVRSSVLSVIQNNYIEAAQALGAGTGRILFRHIVPNSLSPVIVQATMGLASSILSAAALGFLGLGAIAPEPEWGAMLSDSYRYLSSGKWWVVVFPGLAIMLSVLGFNLLGDGLRDALDPRLQI